MLTSLEKDCPPVADVHQVAGIMDSPALQRPRKINEKERVAITDHVDGCGLCQYSVEMTLRLSRETEDETWATRRKR